MVGGASWRGIDGLLVTDALRKTLARNDTGKGAIRCDRTYDINRGEKPYAGRLLL